MNDNVNVIDISSYLEAEAPLEMSEDFDNAGLLVGLTDRNVTRVLVALDITDEVIEEACEKGVQMIVSHHPLFFSCENIRDTDIIGRKIIRLIENGISALCMHTNLDAAGWGVNTVLAQRLGLSGIELLEEAGTDEEGMAYGIPKLGTLSSPMDFLEFMEKVKASLETLGLRYHNAGKMVHRVAVCGGSGGSFLEKAVLKSCDTLVTADIKYDVFLRAKEMGINIIDGDHFCTENVVCPVVRDKLLERFPNLEVFLSSVHGQTARFF